MTQGVVAEKGGMEIGRKQEHVRGIVLGERVLTEGKGDNLEEFRVEGKVSSGPNSLEQLYGNIPGIGLPMGDFGSNYNPNFWLHKGKKIKLGECVNKAVSYSGPAKEYYNMMEEVVDGSPFVLGAGEAGSSQGCRKFKMVARITAR
ncbi:pectinesterase family protein [Corchorus olitorius]|uniref:Pectinesterase family protein n=1 Tax=Corchorus olitorius TaxID=93759 RepID=A0A1R3H1E9_9ROSI|nr:pectinesterase family protein [Corchorus olitorius]